MAQWMSNWGSQALERYRICHYTAVLPIGDPMIPPGHDIEVWLSNPERPGHYYWVFNGLMQRYVFWFEDENLAVEFRMRWG